MKPQIKVDDSKFRSKMQFARSVFHSFFKEVVKKGCLRGTRHMKKEAPVDKGQGRSGITYDISGYGMSGRIHPTHKHMVYQARGTRASDGRYVPAIKKRLVNPKIGRHPGIKPNRYHERAKRLLEEDMPGIIEAEKNKAVAMVRGFT